MKQNSNYNLFVGLGALVGVILIIAVAGYIMSAPKPHVIQGEAEASEYRVSGKVPGRIEELFVKEGQMVNAGDTVAYIDSPEVRAKLFQAQAAVAAATAQRNKAQNGARTEEIAGAYNLWQTAVIQESVMQKSFERINRLYKENVVSAQKFDEVKAKYDASVATAAAAKTRYDMALKGARDEDKEAAQALVDRASGAVMEVQAYMGELYLTAPTSGVVSSIAPKVGELVGTGSPVMTIMDLDDIWFTFNVREDYLKGIYIGSKLSISIPALDGKVISATVGYMAVRESYATWKATKETDMYDAKTFEIRATPDEKVEGLLPGMSVIVER